MSSEKKKKGKWREQVVHNFFKRKQHIVELQVSASTLCLVFTHSDAVHLCGKKNTRPGSRPIQYMWVFFVVVVFWCVWVF